jgi:hypothetical protein
MAVWQYRVFSLPTRGFWSSYEVDQSAVEALLNGLGAEGWELVASVGGYKGSVAAVILKRAAG